MYINYSFNSVKKYHNGTLFVCLAKYLAYHIQSIPSTPTHFLNYSFNSVKKYHNGTLFVCLAKYLAYHIQSIPSTPTHFFYSIDKPSHSNYIRVLKIGNRKEGIL
jgi:hypothetical protein